MEDKLSIKRERTAPNTYVIGAGTTRAVVQFAALPGETTNDVGKVNTVTLTSSAEQVEIMFWGKRNNLPQYREEMIAGNNIVPSLIQRKRDIICGQAWYAYRDRFDGGKRIMDEIQMPAYAEEFFEMFRPAEKEMVGEMCKHALAVPEFIRGEGGKIVSIESKEVKYMRAQRKDANGKINNWFWGNNWDPKRNGGLKDVDRKIVKIPVYKPGAKQNKFIKPLSDSLFNDGYYPIPAYWGGRHWINLSNIIPLFHEANLQHGQTPRWHIIIPHDYFWDYKKLENAIDPDAEAALYASFKQAEKDFVDDLNKVLTGIGNTGRTITSKSEMVEAIGGRHEKKIEIIELKPNLQDEALIKLYNASNIANISAAGLHPTLSNVQTEGRQASGTEMRNAFLMWLIIAAPAYRDQIYSIVDLVKKENGWQKDIKFAIRDAEMTTLSDNPSGFQDATTTVAK